MRVALISPYGVGRHYSGPAILHDRLAAELLRAGSVVEVLSGAPVADAYRARRVSLSGRGRLRQVLWAVVSFTWVLLRAGRFDVVHFVGAYAFNLPGMVAATVRQKPTVLFVASEGGDLRAAADGTLRAAVQRRIVRSASIALALSQGIRKELEDLGVSPAAIVDISNPVDVDHFRPPTRAERTNARANFGIHDERLVLSCCGVVGERKGQALLLDAARELLTGGQQVTVLLAGPTASSWSGHELEHSGCVLRLGMVSDVRSVYWASDVYVLASKQEGMPASVAEAHACGLPAVVTAVGGLPEFASKRPSVHLTDRDAASIVASIWVAVRHRRKGDRGNRPDVQSISAMASEYLQTVGAVVASSRGR